MGDSWSSHDFLAIWWNNNKKKFVQKILAHFILFFAKFYDMGQNYTMRTSKFIFRRRFYVKKSGSSQKSDSVLVSIMEYSICFRSMLFFVRILMTKCQDKVRILAFEKTAGTLIRDVLMTALAHVTCQGLGDHANHRSEI